MLSLFPCLRRAARQLAEFPINENKKSAFENRLPYLYFNLAREGEAIYFCQDGVFPLGTKLAEFNKALEEKRGQGVKLFAFEADVKARAVKSPDDITLIDYDGFIDLLEDYKRVIG